MLKRRNLIILFILILPFSWFTSSGIRKKLKEDNSIDLKKEINVKYASLENIRKKSVEAIDFAKKNNYDESIYF